jgi:CDP-6-deoxy-D-xylo-4-hexulose-3-dehydrase
MSADRMSIKLVKSSFYDEAATKEKLVNFILHARMLSMGDETRKFETAFAAKQGRKYAVLVNSGSSANLILLQALMNIGRIQPRAMVGVSALTWATNVMPIIQLGLSPVAIDVSKSTLNISPQTLQPHLLRLNVVFLTNVLGFSDNIAQIRKVCEEKNIVLLEDNCEALGSRVNGILLGNYGLASTFSFYVAHHLSTVEGGMVCTDNADLYDAMLMARSNGWGRNLDVSMQKELAAKYGVSEFFAKYSFYDLAYNIRPTDITAFIGNVQLPHWDTIVAARARNFARLHRCMRNNSDLLSLDLGHMDLVSNFAMPVIAADEAASELYKARFIEHGVEIRPIIAGDITKQPFFQKYVQQAAVCANAHLIHSRGFYFANNPDLEDKELRYLEKLLRRQ